MQDAIPGVLDFSRFEPWDLAVLNEGALSEDDGLVPSGPPNDKFYYAIPDAGGALRYWTKYATSFWATANAEVTVPVDRRIDWNLSGAVAPAGTSVAANLNAGRDTDPKAFYYDDDKTDAHTWFNDWKALNFKGGNIGQALASLGRDVIVPPTSPDPPNPTTPAYAVEVTGPDPVGVVPGSTSSVAFRIRNVGSNDDTYTIGAESRVGWTDVAGLPSEVGLKAGESRGFTLPVAVKVTTAIGLQDSVEMTATSQRYPDRPRHSRRRDLGGEGVEPNGLCPRRGHDEADQPAG